MMKEKNILLGIAFIFAALTISWAGEQEPSSCASNAWVKIKDGGKRAMVIGKIKAAFADRKDIPGRYIRVKFDGQVMQLAGFVPSKDVAKAAEELARRVGKPDRLLTFWGFDEAIENRESYKTYVREQASDVALTAKVLAALKNPAVRSQLTNAEPIHVNVSHGKVTVYIVADAPPENFELEPHIKPISGVLDFHYRVVTAY